MTSEIETFGKAGYSNRRLHLLELDAAAQLADQAFGFDRHFAVLLDWSEEDLSAGSIAQVSEAILRQGAVSICCWGPDCKNVHAVLGETIRGTDPESSAYPATIMTTWHPRETFEEALWYLLTCSIPEETFESTCRDTLVITIADASSAERTRAAFRDPADFLDRVLDAGDFDAG